MFLLKFESKSILKSDSSPQFPRPHPRLPLKVMHTMCRLHMWNGVLDAGFWHPFRTGLEPYIHCFRTGLEPYIHCFRIGLELNIHCFRTGLEPHIHCFRTGLEPYIHRFRTVYPTWLTCDFMGIMARWSPDGRSEASVPDSLTDCTCLKGAKPVSTKFQWFRQGLYSESEIPGSKPLSEGSVWPSVTWCWRVLHLKIGCNPVVNLAQCFLRDVAQHCNKTRAFLTSQFHLLLPESTNSIRFLIRMRDVFLHATFTKGIQTRKENFLATYCTFWHDILM